jgi:hypothetical protein
MPILRAFTRTLTDWYHQAFSWQLVLLVVLIAGLIAYLVRFAETMPSRRFVGLCVLTGLLGVLLVGTGFRTLTVLKLTSPSFLPQMFQVKVGSMVEKSLSWIKGMIALTAAALSVYEGQLILEKKAPRQPWVKGIALFLAVMSVGAYFRYGDLGYVNYYHRWEFFHYFIGSKYDRELGYQRLYKCAAVAQADSGQINEVRARKLRDLSIDVLAPAQTALDDSGDCRTRFTDERWAAFKEDVRFFRNQSGLQYWNDMQKDHGYNPPPVWTVMGHFWSSRHAADDGYIKFLACFDLAFWIGLFGAIWWAFGWRVFAVAAIFWGCQLPAEYFWTGGAFMRHDWIFWLVLSGCLMRKRYFALGGAAFAYSTLLRVFPGILLVGMAMVAGAYVWKQHVKLQDHERIARLALIVTAGLTVVTAGVLLYLRTFREADSAAIAAGATESTGMLTSPLFLGVVALWGLWGLTALGYVLVRKLMDPSHVRVMAGGLIATFVLVGISGAVAGWRAYPEFYHHIQVHNHTPLTNNMGLQTIFAQSPEGGMEFVRDEKQLDPFAQWKQMRRDRLHAFRWLHRVAVIGLLLALGRVAVRIKRLWIAQALSLAILVSIIEVTCYYYTMFILTAFLSRHRKGIEQWILAIAGISQLVAINRYFSYFYDWRYWSQSVVFCVLAISLIFAYWPRQKKTETSKAPVGAVAKPTLGESSGVDFLAEATRPSQPAPAPIASS